MRLGQQLASNTRVVNRGQAALFHSRSHSLLTRPKPHTNKAGGFPASEDGMRHSPYLQQFVSQAASVFSLRDLSLPRLLISGPQSFTWFNNRFQLSRQQQLRLSPSFLSYFPLLPQRGQCSKNMDSKMLRNFTSSVSSSLEVLVQSNLHLCSRIPSLEAKLLLLENFFFCYFSSVVGLGCFLLIPDLFIPFSRWHLLPPATEVCSLLSNSVHSKPQKR